MISYPVPISLGSADSKGFQEPALSRQGDDDSAAVPHSLGPTEIEEVAGERCSHRAGDVWPTFGPVEAQSAEPAARRTQCRQIDPEPGEKTRAGLGDFRTFVGEESLIPGRGDHALEHRRRVLLAPLFPQPGEQRGDAGIAYGVGVSLLRADRRDLLKTLAHPVQKRRPSSSMVGIPQFRENERLESRTPLQSNRLDQPRA